MPSKITTVFIISKLLIAGLILYPSRMLLILSIFYSFFRLNHGLNLHQQDPLFLQTISPPVFSLMQTKTVMNQAQNDCINIDGLYKNTDNSTISIVQQECLVKIIIQTSNNSKPGFGEVYSTLGQNRLSYWDNSGGYLDVQILDDGTIPISETESWTKIQFEEPPFQDQTEEIISLKTKLSLLEERLQKLENKTEDLLNAIEVLQTKSSNGEKEESNESNNGESNEETNEEITQENNSTLNNTESTNNSNTTLNVEPRQRFFYGITSPTSWVQYNVPFGIYVDVDISQYNFTKPPLIFTSLAGNSLHWNAIGVTSIYGLTNTTFRVYVQELGRPVLSPLNATNSGWVLSYVAFSNDF